MASENRHLSFWSLSTVIVYVGGYIFLVFFAVCLASGLYYLAELVEEYSRLTKKCISYAIKGIMAIHVILLLVDRLPILPIVVGLASYGAYLHMLKTFPYISLLSNGFLASVGFLIASHFFWFRFFMFDPRCAHISIEWVFGFMLVMVWVVPFVFFISLAANESVLPLGVASGPYQGYVRSDVDPSHMGGGRKSRGTLLGIFNFLRKKRDEVLPIAMSHIPNSYLRKNDKPL